MNTMAYCCIQRSKMVLIARAKEVINRENMQKAFEVEVAIENITITKKAFTCVFPIKVKEEFTA